MENLSGKIALITGGNSGIGFATAKILRDQQAEVVITGRRKEAVTAAADSLKVKGILADQASLADTDRLVEAIKKEYGKIDILFINAGVAKLFGMEGASEEQFDEVMNINFKGAYFTLSKFIPVLNDNASVIFLSSIVSRKSSAASGIYSASKAALNSVMTAAALELAPRGIRVNAVSPGPTKTDAMSKSGLDESTLKVVMNSIADRIPVKRLGEAEEIGELVAFLAGDKSKFITGSEFTIDGGFMLL